LGNKNSSAPIKNNAINPITGHGCKLKLHQGKLINSPAVFAGRRAMALQGLMEKKDCFDVSVCMSGVPDFSWYNIPKRETMYQINIKYTKWP
jgi:hypothetical protein